jgi:hypothetical protein
MPKKKKTKSKKVTRKKPAARSTKSSKKAASRSRLAASKKKTTSSRKPAKSSKRRVREKEQVENGLELLSRLNSQSGRQAGDLQGISTRRRADSESVNELLEEGNTFEAGAVAGVEEADDEETREVHTHEVLEDDVPEEYLDQD